jgi:hypothetical protein
MAVRRHLAGTLAVPLLLGPLTMLSGCGGDDSVADPPVSSAPTSSPTQSPHRESAEHFIRRWAAEDTRIQKTGNTTTFRQMSRGCAGCQRLANLVEGIYSAGGYIHTKGWKVRRIASQGSGSYVLDVFATSTTYTESAHGKIRHLPSGPARFQLRLHPTPESWRVISLVQVAN